MTTKPGSTPTKRDWILVIAVGLTACLPLYVYGVPFVGDLPHHYRTALGFYESILNGNLYPSWHPSTNGGYGDPSVRFYPPALYFLLCSARLVTRDWFVASLVSYVLLTTIGSVGMYLWARCFTTHSYALAAGLLYLLSPFHTNEIYQAGMYGQYAAGNVLPFVFAFVERIIKGKSRRDIAGLGISYGFVILFHVPLVVIGSISIAIYALIRLIQSRNVRSVYGLVTGIALGIALSCFYWLPVMREIKWKYPSGIGQGPWFDYKNNFLFGPSPSVMSNFLLPLLAGATLAMAAPTLVLVFRRNSQALAPAVVALLGFLMATPVSKSIWDSLPVLQETQFPWRWMTVTSLCLSLLVTISLPELSLLWRSRWRPLSLALIGFVVIAFSFTILQLIRGAPLYHRVAFNEKVEAQRGSATNQDFLPVWANATLLHPMNAPVEAGNRRIDVVTWSAEHKLFTLDAGQESEARVKTLYYPLWIATANGQRLATKPAADGALLVSAPTEKTTIDIKFTEPVSTYLAGAVSICALLMVVLLLAFEATALRRGSLYLE